MPDIRITGGELRGRRLYVPKSGVRPTTGRVREALFSMLGDIDGAKVLDLFCGSGALGIEALSRGAAEAWFVDKEVSAVMRNVKELGIADGEWNWMVQKSDVLGFLEANALHEPNVTYDLILCDPPYRLAAALEAGLDRSIPGVFAEGARMALETATRDPLELSLPMIKERVYGDTLLRIYSSPEGRNGGR